MPEFLDWPTELSESFIYFIFYNIFFKIILQLLAVIEECFIIFLFQPFFKQMSVVIAEAVTPSPLPNPQSHRSFSKKVFWFIPVYKCEEA